jgi:hypothetical protein
MFQKKFDLALVGKFIGALVLAGAVIVGSAQASDDQLYGRPVSVSASNICQGGTTMMLVDMSMYPTPDPLNFSIIMELAGIDHELTKVQYHGVSHDGDMWFSITIPNLNLMPGSLVTFKGIFSTTGFENMFSIDMLCDDTRPSGSGGYVVGELPPNTIRDRSFEDDTMIDMSFDRQPQIEVTLVPQNLPHLPGININPR